MAAPIDVNVPFCEQNELVKKIKFAEKLGYEGVAINYELPELLLEAKKGKKDKVSVKSPDEIRVKEDVLKAAIGPTRKPFQQLTRISVVLSDVSQSYIIQNATVRSFDIIAVKPTSEKTFQQACSVLNVDIIIIEVLEKLAFQLKRNMLNVAIRRGIHFELQYSHAIRDVSLRTYLISNAQKLVFWCKGKNIILSSGCQKAMEIRGPFDVANLGILFNMNENQAKDAVTNNCRALLCHIESRKLNKSVMKVEKISDLSPANAWIVEKCNVIQESNTNTKENGTMCDDNKCENNVKNDIELETVHCQDTNSEQDSANEPVKKKIKLKAVVS